MIDQELHEDVTAWYDRYLIRQEHQDHVGHLIEQAGMWELGLRHHRAGPPPLKVGLAKLRAARNRVRNADWGPDNGVLEAEANVLLGRAADTGFVGIHLGIAGEEAYNYVRDLRAGRSGWGGSHRLGALVESRRLVQPASGRCDRCHVARSLAQLDEFTSPTSSEFLFVCRGRQDPPNRPDLGPWVRWLDGWGSPCCDPEYAPEPATVD